LKLTFFLLSLLFSIPLSFAQEPSEGWERLSDLPLARSEFTGNAVATNVYLIQGFGTGTNFTMYNTITGTYHELSPVPYSAHHSASAVHNGKIYVAGGCTFGDLCPTAVVYDIASNTWVQLPDMPLPNLSPTAKIVNNHFFVIGGIPNANACQKYNIATNTWSFCADLLTGRNHLSSAVYDNKIYVINGRGGDSGDLTANEVYNPVTNSWQILADKPTGMAGGWGGIFNDKIFVMGGENSLTGANEWYDPVTDLWTIGPDMPTPRHGLVCEPVGSKIYCFGGGTVEGGGPSAVVEVFDANSFLQSAYCNPPGAGDWTLTQSCILNSSSSAAGNIIVPNNVVLTIPNNLTLGVDFANFGLTINSGGGVLIKSGGTLQTNS